ncbi:SixA phosphatase family protein [Daejeonella oryzae]|uniref:SixA phosphatase family protein n=1 Tax=Daejeonella oryzae TaxID=1122943 RepID=UPI00041D2489|nr:histidine phosphatase family protein [Daejeonella oryzae]
MKQLLLIRHAKSDWNDPSQKDFDRPLNDRGHRNAPEMAHRLVKKSIIPQHIVTSPAMRAKTTANYFAEAFKIKPSGIQKEPAIYEASAESLLKVINSLDNTFDLVALFGHNPGLTTFAENLCEADIFNIPTCGMVLIEFPFDNWEMVSKGTGKMIFFDFPKNKEQG